MIQLILPLVIFLNLLLSAFVIIQDRKSWNHRLLSLLSFTAAIWTFTNFYTAFSPIPFWINSSYATGALVLAAGLVWTFFITDGFLRLSKIISISLIALFFATSSFIEGFIAKDYGIIQPGGVFTGKPGYGLILYSLFFFTVVFIICYKLFIAQRREPDTNRKLQFRYIFYGALSTLSISALTSFLFPLFNIFQFTGLDSIGFLIFLSFVTYAIIWHRLLDIKVIASELFIFAIWLFMLLRVFLVNTLQEQLIAGGLLAALVIFGILLIRSVLSEIKQREQIQLLNLQLEKSIQELQKIDELKTEFVNLASHQLRTPLTPIKGYADMLRRGDFGGTLEKPEQREAVENIYLSAERMVKLIDDLLDISKLEKEGGFTYNFQIGNPEIMVKKIADETQDQAKAKGLALSFESTLSGEVKIKFDPLKFTDAVENIINNAVKYTKEGNIWVKIFDDDGHVLISIKDTGAGISSEDLDKLFQKFFRGKEIARLATEGTGLGLYFTRRVIEDHGGRISVYSEGVGKGSEFTITIPKTNGEIQLNDVPKPPPPPPTRQ